MKFCKRQGAALILTCAAKMTSCHGKVGLAVPPSHNSLLQRWKWWTR